MMAGDDENTLQAGTRFGAYEIRREIGRGGMGVVYHADGPSGEAALKVLHAGAHADLARRFERETMVAVKVRHENIANAVDAGVHDGRPYLASEFVDGVNVAQLVTMTGPISEVEARVILRDVTAALAALAEAETLHRDLKPQNILVARDGTCRVVDFGLALPRTGTLDLRTQTGAFLGTPLYVAPEQILGDGTSIDARCDLYALGCVAFYCLAGRAPFRGRSQFAILQQHLDAPIPELSKFDIDASSSMQDLISLLLAKDPARRPVSARALLDDRQSWFGEGAAQGTSELGRRVDEALSLVADMGALRPMKRPLPSDLEADLGASSASPERVIVLVTGDEPGPDRLILSSGGPGRRWVVDVVGGDFLAFGESPDEASVAVRVIAGAAVVVVQEPGVEASLNDRTLMDEPRNLTRRGRVRIGATSWSTRQVQPPDDDQLFIGDDIAPFGPAVVLRDPSDSLRSTVLVPGRFSLPGGAEILAAGGGLWLREDETARALKPGDTFLSGAIEVGVAAWPETNQSR